MVMFKCSSQAYCNIVAGACFAIGLKYAGSADERAFKSLLRYCHRFTSLTGKSIADLAGKPTIETCLNVTLISSAMVCILSPKKSNVSYPEMMVVLGDGWNW